MFCYDKIYFGPNFSLSKKLYFYKLYLCPNFSVFPQKTLFIHFSFKAYLVCLSKKLYSLRLYLGPNFSLSKKLILTLPWSKL